MGRSEGTLRIALLFGHHRRGSRGLLLGALQPARPRIGRASIIGLRFRAPAVQLAGWWRTKTGPPICSGSRVVESISWVPTLWEETYSRGCSMEARVSATAALLGVLLTVSFGALVGAAAAIGGGIWDRWLMRTTELFMALPALYLILAIRNVFPDDLAQGWTALILVGSLALVGWCGVSRLVRGHVLSLRERDFATSAVAAGAGQGRLFFRHILPNTLPLLLLQVGLTLPYFLLGEATLSFLGLGVQEPPC